jgi:hypothetical protein
MKEPEFDYAGFEKCGCLVGLVSEDYRDRKFIDRVISKWVREGLSVKRIPFVEIKNLLNEKGFGCKCSEKIETEIIEKQDLIEDSEGKAFRKDQMLLPLQD